MTQTENNTPKMMTVRQVAQLKILPERALRLLVAQHKIPVVKSGKVAYINYNALEGDKRESNSDCHMPK
jgi:hypothetical protein